MAGTLCLLLISQNNWKAEEKQRIVGESDSSKGPPYLSLKSFLYFKIEFSKSYL